jgi:RHS repeat-associated protein
LVEELVLTVVETPLTVELVTLPPIAGSLSATYNYPTGSNNGKISSSVINGETVTYQYDSLNRMIQATSSAGWGEQYGFDAFGNLTTKTPTAGSAPTLSVNVNPATNQIQGVYGLSYDANGNEYYGGVNYDAENRIVTAPGLQYSYDARNKRIWSWNGALDPSGWGNASGYNIFLYSPGGQRLGTYRIDVINNGYQYTNLTLQSTLISTDLFFGGRRLAVQDRLGSVGSYFPYGEARPGTNPLDTWSFATYWRDSATSLDYADQRYYSNQFGRFMSPDPYKASGGPNDPGSWNRYSYVQGDPVNYTDRTGLNRDAEDCIDDPDACEAEDWGGLGGWWPLNPVSEPTVPAKILVEENQLDGLQNEGVISSYSVHGGAWTIDISDQFYNSLVAGGALVIGPGGVGTLEGIGITIGEAGLTITITVTGVAVAAGVAAGIVYFAKQTNEVLDDAKQAISYRGPGDLKRLCDYLYTLYDAAASAAEKLKIYAALKFAGCQRAQKRRGGPGKRPLDDL